MFVDDLFDKKSLTEAQGGGSPWHSEPEQQQMDADRRGRLGRERNAGLDEPDDAASGPAQTGNGVYEYTVPAGQESTAQELGLQQHRGHWFSRVPIQRANFQFGRPQFHKIPAPGVAEGDRPGMKDGRPYSDPLRRHPGNDSYMTPEYLIQKYQDELKKIAAGPYKRTKDVAMYKARIAKLQRQQGMAEGSEDLASLRAKANEISNRIDAIVKDGGRVGFNDSLSRQLKAIRSKIQQAKKKGVAEGSDTAPETAGKFLYNTLTKSLNDINIPYQQGTDEYNRFVQSYKKAMADQNRKYLRLGMEPEKLAKYLGIQDGAKWIRNAQGVGEGYQFKGPFPFDVDHMHGGRGINLPVADTRDLLQKPFEYYGNYKEWYRDVNRVNSELLDDNAEYTTTAGGKTISINGKPFAAWTNRLGNGSIDIRIAKKYGQQGVAEVSESKKFKVTYELQNGDVKEKIMIGKDAKAVAKYFEFKYRHKPISVIEQGVAEGMLDNPGEPDSPVAQAIIRRILLQRTDLLAKHGPEKVGAAVDEVADFVGDVDEIGSSDVSGWVRHVEQMLGNMQQDVEESKSIKQAHKTKRDRLIESYVLKDPLYEQWRGVGRYISERKMSEKEILQVFADAETGMTNKGTGANRTMLGRGKDTTMAFAGSVKDAVSGVLNSIQNSVPVSAVDVAYDQATDAVAGLAGGQRGKVMQAIKGYRNLVKEYPKASGFAKAALVAIAGLATGGASLPAIAGLTYALDSAIRGDKLSSVIGKGAGATAVTWGAQQVAGALGDLGTDSAGTGGQTISAEELKSMGMQQRPDGTWGVAVGDTLPNGATVIEIHPDYIVSELRPVDTASSLGPGESIVNADTPLPQGATVRCPLGSCNGDVWQVKPGETLNDIAQQIGVPPQELAQLNPGLGGGGGTYTIVKGDQLGYIAQAQGTTPEAIRAANPDINFAKALQPGTEINLPAGTPAQGSVWSDYKGGMYGDKVAKDAVRESILPAITLRQLPTEKLIDKQGTIMSWALQESIGVKRKSVNLTTTGAYTVFENIDRYRQAIMEKAGVPGSTRPAYYRPDMPDGPGKKSKPGIVGKGLNWLDKTAGKVGSALGNFGHQFTTNVTKEKLKMNWHQAGKPSDSDQLAAFLNKQGVPQEVVTTVYGKMGIPYTAPVVEPKAQLATNPATTGKSGIQTGATALIDPDTKRPYEKDKLAAMYGYKDTAAVTPSASATTAAAPATTTAATSAAATTNPAAFNAGNVMKLPGMEKYAKPAAAPKTANFGASPTGYAKTTYSVKPPAAPSSPALAAPSVPKVPRVTAGGPTPAEKANLAKRIAASAPAVAETMKQIDRMLESVNSKKSAEIVRAYADQQFAKLGLRNTTECKQIMAHVVHESAVRRRAYAQRMAK